MQNASKYEKYPNITINPRNTKIILNFTKTYQNTTNMKTHQKTLLNSQKNRKTIKLKKRKITKYHKQKTQQNTKTMQNDTKYEKYPYNTSSPRNTKIILNFNKRYQNTTNMKTHKKYSLTHKKQEHYKT